MKEAIQKLLKKYYRDNNPTIHPAIAALKDIIENEDSNLKDFLECFLRNAPVNYQNKKDFTFFKDFLKICFPNHSNITFQKDANKINPVWAAIVSLNNENLFFTQEDLPAFISALSSHKAPEEFAEGLIQLHNSPLSDEEYKKAVMSHPSPTSYIKSLIQLQNIPEIFTEEHKQLLKDHKIPDALVTQLISLHQHSSLTTDNKKTLLEINSSLGGLRKEEIRNIFLELTNGLIALEMEKLLDEKNRKTISCIATRHYPLQEEKQLIIKRKHAIINFTNGLIKLKRKKLYEAWRNTFSNEDMIRYLGLWNEKFLTSHYLELIALNENSMPLAKAAGLLSLKNILTEKNFDTLLNCPDIGRLKILTNLSIAQLLNQKSFDKVMSQPNLAFLIGYFYTKKSKQKLFTLSPENYLFSDEAIAIIKNLPRQIYEDNFLNQLIEVAAAENPHTALTNLANTIREEARAQQNRYGALDRNNRVDDQSTHTASVHLSVALSLQRLFDRYPMNATQINEQLNEIYQFPQEIKSGNFNHLNGEKATENFCETAIRGIKRFKTMVETMDVKEALTGYSLDLILALIWKGINDKKCHHPHIDLVPKENFIRAIYNIQREYAKKNSKKDVPCCDGGTINELLNSSLNGIHRDVTLELINGNAVADLAQMYAKKIFLTHYFHKQASHPTFIEAIKTETAAAEWINKEVEEWYENCIQETEIMLRTMLSDKISRLRENAKEGNAEQLNILCAQIEKYIAQNIFSLKENKYMLDIIKDGLDKAPIDFSLPTNVEIEKDREQALMNVLFAEFDENFVDEVWQTIFDLDKEVETYTDYSNNTSASAQVHSSSSCFSNSVPREIFTPESAYTTCDNSPDEPLLKASARALNSSSAGMFNSLSGDAKRSREESDLEACEERQPTSRIRVVYEN